MMHVENRLAQLGLELPEPPKLGPGVRLSFSSIRVAGPRVLISGHSAQYPDGRLAGPFGKVGAEVSLEEAYESAKLTAVSMLGSLQREIGDLDQIEGWVRAFGMVNAAPEFTEFPAVVNGWSDLILEIFGFRIGHHARSAIGVAGLPWNMCVEIEAELVLKP